MSKKLPKYKKDALHFLLDWANKHFNASGNASLGYSKLAYSKEHDSITFYPCNTDLPELEVGLNNNVKGRVQLRTSMGDKVTVGDRLNDTDVSKLSSSISQVLQKVPFTYTIKYGKERPIGFHYSTHNGVLSVKGTKTKYMYPGS